MMPPTVQKRLFKFNTFELLIPSSYYSFKLKNLFVNVVYTYTHRYYTEGSKKMYSLFEYSHHNGHTDSRSSLSSLAASTLFSR
jgi:hypothetical protein